MALLPSRTKYRKQQRGSVAGLSKGGSFVQFGEFGMQSLDRGWITGQQIEACRIAITRFFSRKGQVLISQCLKSRLKLEWVQVRELPNFGLLALNLDAFFLKLPMLPEKKRKKL